MIIVLIVLIVAIVSCYCYHQPIVTVRKAINTDHNKKYQKINKIGPQIKMMSSTKNIRTKTYSSIIKQLYEINMYNPVKMGLDNMLQLNQLMGDPLQNTSIVHITGTNGKGSVAWKISSCLKNSNIRTGMFISPHISSFKERIQINGQLIGSKDIVVSPIYRS